MSGSLNSVVDDGIHVGMVDAAATSGLDTVNNQMK